MNEHKYNKKVRELEWKKVQAEDEYKGRKMEIEKEIEVLKFKRQQLLESQKE
ncbi:hypothetical protein G3A_07185 [Bacillus sp. 17376]|uniref:Uncharacterized protein n=1 Tax=Mesobacillus boroniphilus JCM 21738 TaxID=1294265 RepID=W4RVL0_9BACI|nr:hypothetical protein [Mesobacillus boroniphilus]ESU33241.1 hypothetical protein G3A_07185 [Bacillus sp. 17376]GAE48162.1 hypothetical protein JCM21738_5246 [Mesobacillus boroniphilus JCM 21738]